MRAAVTGRSGPSHLLSADPDLADLADRALLRDDGPEAVQAVALRTRSTDLLRLLDGLGGAGPRWQVAAAVVRAALVPEDRARSTEALLRVVRADGTAALRARDQLVLAQLLYGAGRYDEMEELLPALDGLEAEAVEHLTGDVLARRWGAPGPDGYGERWWSSFTGPWREAGLLVPELHAEAGAPLLDGLRVDADALATARRRLSAELEQRGLRGDGVPLVSVVVTSFRPDEGLRTALRSLQQQTWPRVEVVVVDDCSGPGYATLYEEVGSTPGVRVVHQDENGGAYVARNRGVAEAGGAFVTFHDYDDWAHPQRLERQVLPLLAPDGPPATHSRSLRVLPDLDRQWLGYPATRTNASSLLAPASTLRRVGVFDPVRKGADAEYHQRLVRLTGQEVRTVDEVLAVVRLRSDSLSRGDFAMGWARAARIGHQDAYRAWHSRLGTTSPTPDLSGATSPASRPFPAPRSWLPGQTDDRSALLVVADLTLRRLPDGTETVAALEELAGALGTGRVLVLHREDPWQLRRARPRTDSRVRGLLDAGAVVQVYPEEPVTVQDAVVLDPRCVLLRRPSEHLRVGRLTVVEQPGGLHVSATRRIRRTAGTWAGQVVTVPREPHEPWARTLSTAGLLP